MQAAVQAVAEITGQSGVDYLVNNAGTAGPPVPAHEEYKSVKHSHLSPAAALQSANTMCRTAFICFQVHISCILVSME